jgi:gluconokinase
MISNEYIIGIDAGTSGVKALAFSQHGKLLGSRKKNWTVLPADEGCMEHDPEILVAGTLVCLYDLMGFMGHSPRAIGFCTFMHSLMPVDNHIRPLANLQLWNDNRSAPAARKLKSSPLGKDIYEHTGTPLHPMSPLAKIGQMQLSEPELFKKAAAFIGIKEYLMYRFTGKLLLDYATASATGLFDTIKKQWYGPALDWCGISSSQLGELTLPMQTYPCILGNRFKDVMIVPGLTDGSAANLGSGNTDSSEFTLTLGTSGAVRFTGQDKTTDPEGVLFSYCLDEVNFISGGASNNCFNVVEHLCSQLGVNLKDIEGNEFADPVADDLLFLPWMYGERAPVQLLSPLTGFVNPGPSYTALHQVKSATTCILYNLKHIAQKLTQLNGREFTCLHISGGFAHFESIKQMVSSIFNIPVLEHSTGESSALGTAIFTARAMGMVNDYRDILTWNPVIAIRQPDRKMAEQYESGYNRFRKISSAYVKRGNNQ